MSDTEYTYAVSVRFSTDRALTAYELDAIEGAILTQVEEPVDEDGAPVTFITTGITTLATPMSGGLVPHGSTGFDFAGYYQRCPGCGNKLRAHDGLSAYLVYEQHYREEHL